MLLAYSDDKFYLFPKDNTIKEISRSKYWFKQWWHLKITDVKNVKKNRYEIIYYIFSDQPRNTKSTNFDKKIVTKAQYKSELAKNEMGLYLIGANKEDTGNKNYPSIKEIDTTLNLTKKFGIKRIEYSGYHTSSMRGKLGHRINILFDGLGNIFQSEGLKGDSGDINPLDTKRKMIIKEVEIKLCLDNPCINTNNRCSIVAISPVSGAYRKNCKNF
ncbi:MAG: hypothetical protein GXO62_07510 [Epsilonproteobacteria bacterium]|nr:hypothetical protein [Campylobacterota bacterium]